ncbi:hypothetical protein KVR01_011710 [Diaporthe batatas]|uniref:uncharacterized protein n=1 Tax=Diaporthe batatas TaxID=748121 RepID=UPI001D03D2F0|nr:uncharacterized protein KVR01_011710 [Diaporthe batatas]KAG8158588.1 hypothetical protein KVR01_011710 [Diaporthe batatas]
MPPTQAEIASAKADLAVLLTKQFQDDINQLRDALDSANQLVALLKTENATLKYALKEAVEDYDFDANIPPITRARNGSAGVPEAEGWGLQRPPPEGTIFCNGGAYGAKRDNRQLMQEVNRWTQAHGYKVNIYRSKLSGTKVKMMISCSLGGRSRDLALRREGAEAEAERARAMGFHAFVLPDANAAQAGQVQLGQTQQPDGAGPSAPAKRPRKKMAPRRKDCPLRFILQELVAGSGAFVVKHAELPSQQRCNHEPQVKFAADPKASASASAAGQDEGQDEGQEELDTDAEGEEDDSELEE